MKKVNHNSKRGFSIAEAMITLLIVSIMLAAMAPIMSKRRVSGGSSTSGVPAGAIMFFDLDSCPATWTVVSTDENDLSEARLVGFSQGDSRGVVSEVQYVERSDNQNGIAVKTVPYLVCKKNAVVEEGNN